jgi:hypothetical protein
MASSLPPPFLSGSSAGSPLAKMNISAEVDLVSCARSLLKAAVGPVTNWRDDREHRKLLRDVFAVRDTLYLRPGATHPQFPREVHPDNLDAANHVRLLLVDRAKEVHVVDEIELTAGNQMIFGSPRSTGELTRLLGLIGDRHADPLRNKLPFQLKYTFGGWKSSTGSARRYIGRKEFNMPLGAVYQIATGKPIVFDRPRPEDDEWLSCDAILVTRIPNLLDEASYIVGDDIVSVAGVTGVGTKVAGHLLSRRDLLEDIAGKTRGARAFQALIRVDRVIHDDGQSQPDPSSIRVEDVVPIEVDEKSAARWMRRRSKKK